MDTDTQDTCPVSGISLDECECMECLDHEDFEDWGDW